MSFSVRQQLFFWGILLIVSIILLSFIGNILLPFVAGTALAYLLDPLADRLQRVGFNRLWAVIFISFIFILVFAPLAVFIFANLVDQLTKLISAAPTISEKLTKALNGALPSITIHKSNNQNQIDTDAATRGAAAFAAASGFTPAFTAVSPEVAGEAAAPGAAASVSISF